MLIALSKNLCMFRHSDCEFSVTLITREPSQDKQPEGLIPGTPQVSSHTCLMIYVIKYTLAFRKTSEHSRA